MALVFGKAYNGSKNIKSTVVGWLNKKIYLHLHSNFKTIKAKR